MAKKVTITREEWLEALGEAESDFYPDAKTIEELTEILGLSRRRTQERVAKLVKEGKLKRVRTKRGKLRLSAYLVQ